jgi:hypothetical protein
MNFSTIQNSLIAAGRSGDALPNEGKPVAMIAGSRP